MHGRERFQLYLEPGNNLTINLNAREFDESITFFGNGEKNNTFLNLVKDFLVVTLSLGLTVLVIFVAWRLFRILF